MVLFLFFVLGDVVLEVGVVFVDLLGTKNALRALRPSCVGQRHVQGVASKELQNCPKVGRLGCSSCCASNEKGLWSI